MVPMTPSNDALDMRFHINLQSDIKFENAPIRRNAAAQSSALSKKFN